MRTTSSARIRRRSLLLGLVLALVLAGCDKPPNAGSPASGGGGVKFAGVFCVCFASAYIAWKQGFFEDEGVKVEDFVMTSGGADTFAALAGGDADFGLSGLDAIIRGQETGIDVRAVATISPEFYALSVRQQLAGQITSVPALKGHKVSVSKIGSASWAFLKLLLEKHNMTDKDVQIVQLGSIDTTMTGLRTGKVDAAVTWEPGSSQGTSQGFAKLLVNSLDPADHKAVFGSDASISMTLGMRQELIDKNPELVKGAVRALDKAGSWMHSHSVEDVANVIQPLAEGVDHDLLVASVKATMATMPTTVAVSKAAYTASAERLQAAGIVKEVPPIEQVFSCDIAECVG